MRLKKLVVALAMSAVFAGVVAGSALGNASTKRAEWWVWGSTLTTGSPVSATCRSEGNFALEGQIAGAKLKMVSTLVFCLEAKIEEVEVGGVRMAVGSTKLQFNGVTVSEPAGCGVKGKAFTTTALKTDIQMEGLLIYDKFSPASGETLALVSITGCAAEGVYALTGTTFGLNYHAGPEGEELTNVTGEEFTAQLMGFSPTVNAIAGGAVKLGGNTATLTGVLNTELPSALVFGVDEF